MTGRRAWGQPSRSRSHSESGSGPDPALSTQLVLPQAQELEEPDSAVWSWATHSTSLVCPLFPHLEVTGGAPALRSPAPIVSP